MESRRFMGRIWDRRREPSTKGLAEQKLCKTRRTGDYGDGASYTSSVGFAATYTSSDAFRATFPSRGRLRYSFLLTVAIAMLEFFTVTITKMFCLFLRGKNLRGLPLKGKANSALRQRSIA